MRVADIICGGELDAAQLLETTGLPAGVRFEHCSWSRHAQVIQRVELPHVKRLHAHQSKPDITLQAEEGATRQPCTRPRITQKRP